MRHIRFSDEIEIINQRLPFFLATEEWVARNLPEDEYFFSWQVDPTVICGRNQEIDKEVNLEYCRGNNIDVVRRRSGGGAVFADRENFMFSYITAGDNVTEEFARYTSMIAEALRGIGIDATATGRNDITIGERKVSGNAFYHLPGKCIAHGTMLYNFDPHHISSALTPSRAKMESKGVKSVPNRVTCLKNEGISLSPTEFERYMIGRLTSGEPYIITYEDYHAIKSIEAGYYDPSFMRISLDKNNKTGEKGRGLNHICRSIRVDGLGEFCVDYDLDNKTNQIHDLRLTGDFFMSADVDMLLCRPLEGCELKCDELSDRLQNIDLNVIIPGLSPEALKNLLLG